MYRRKRLINFVFYLIFKSSNLIYLEILFCHLEHEIWDDSVEGAVLVVQRLSLFAGAQLAEVFGGLRDGVAEELHDDAADDSHLAVDGIGHGELKEDAGIGGIARRALHFAFFN